MVTCKWEVLQTQPKKFLLILYFLSCLELPNSGQYVTDRRSCTFHAEGGSSYSASARTKIILFRLAGACQWLGHSTFRIMFDSVNNDPNPATKKLRPIRKAHAFFRRLRISAREQIREDIGNYNRVLIFSYITNTILTCKRND